MKNQVNISHGDIVFVEDTGNKMRVVVEGENVRLDSSTVCEACGENEAGDYEIGGHFVCPACVNSALGFIVVREIIENMGDYNIPLARAVAILEEEDARNSRSHVPYVDSRSGALDAMKGDLVTTRDYMTPTFNTCMHAMCEPGSIV